MSAEIFFKANGYNQGYGGSMHITDMSKGIMGMNGIVGASFYMAAGAALRGMVRGTQQVGVAFFGDGAAASPYYFSAIRSCANHKRAGDLRRREQFPLHGHFGGLHLSDQVPLGVHERARYSASSGGRQRPGGRACGDDRSRGVGPGGQRPEHDRGITYRWYDHAGFAGGKVGQDGAMGLPYRTDDELRGWISRDPIQRYTRWLLAKDLASEAELASIDAETQAAVDASVEFARQGADPNPEAGVLNTHAAGGAAATQFYNRRGLAT